MYCLRINLVRDGVSHACELAELHGFEASAIRQQRRGEIGALNVQKGDLVSDCNGDMCTTEPRQLHWL
jgi:hypothetical protein